MGYINPLLNLPAGRALLRLAAPERMALAAVLRELRAQANDEAETAWRRRKAPMAAYWRAVATYARHTAHALTSPERARTATRLRGAVSPRPAAHAEPAHRVRARGRKHVA